MEGTGTLFGNKGYKLLFNDRGNDALDDGAQVDYCNNSTTALHRQVIYASK